MPSRVNVVDLQVLVLKTLSNRVKLLCDEKSISIYDLADVVSYFRLVPPCIQAEVCRLLIADFKKKPHAEKVNEKHLFFCVYLNSEEFFMNEFDNTLLFLNDLKGTHFKKMTLNGSIFPTMDDSLQPDSLRFRIYRPLYSFMSSLLNLTSFHSARMCDDNMFSIFSEYCPNLEDIEVELSYSLSDEGVCQLCGFNSKLEVENVLRTGELIRRKGGCKNLKKVILDFTVVTNISVAALLQWCPKLEVLNVSPDIDIGIVFTKLHGFDSSTYNSISRKYNLTTLCSSLEIEEDLLSLIVQTCPNLQDVAIRCYGFKRKDKNLIANLLSLPITSLDLMNCNTGPLLWYLGQRGHCISKLVIEHLISAPQGVFLNRSHLQFIISACPNVTHFTLKMCANMSISPNVPYSSFGDDIKYFTTLKFLYIEGVNLQPEDLKILLIRCKDLEDVRLICQSLEVLEDHLLYELLAAGALKKLKKFYAFRPLLTFSGLQRLLAECPDLRTVGPLSSWVIPKREREKLLDDIKKNNWNLNIESPETAGSFFL